MDLTERRRLILLGVVGFVLAVWSSWGPELISDDLHWSVTPLASWTRLVAGIVWIPVLLITYQRDPGGPMWKLVLFSLAANGTWVLGYLPNEQVWTLVQVLGPLSDIVFVHLVLAFPTGRLAHRFDRRLLGFLYFTAVMGAISYLFWRPPFYDAPECQPLGVACPRNVLLIWPNEGISTVFRQLNLLVPLFALLVLVELRRHWREAGPVGRRALAPIVVGVPIVFAILVPWYVAQGIDRDEIRQFLLNPIFTLPKMIVPAGFLIGLLRTRLARGSVADLAVEIGRGVPLGGMQDALARTLRDPTLELGFAAPDGDGFVDPAGRPLALPEPGSTDRSMTRIEHDGELLAILVHDRALDLEAPGLVEAVASVAGMALDNERLAAQVRAQLEEVRASRARIVEAGDIERRRVERDLHDGAQQRLVALALRLEAARGTTEEADRLIDETTAELGTAIGEVRRLARGLHPTILTEAGLRAAVEALAETAAVPVTVDIPDERYPELVEATAYYVIAESLTNVARYAGASGVVVRVTESGGRLLVAIEDDGRGGADPAVGSGLRGLVDRVAALGGSFRIESPPGAGTRVLAEVPVA